MMSNDTVWNYVNDFVSGVISREAFWALAKFRHPTHQICFHTPAALACIKFVKADEIERVYPTKNTKDFKKGIGK